MNIKPDDVKSYKRFIDSIYFVSNKMFADWQATIFHTADEPYIWELEYRFRTYTEDKPFCDTDEKRWGGLKAKADVDQDEALKICRDTIRGLIPGFEKVYGNPVDIVELQCWNDDSKLFFELGSRPWANMLTGKEAEEYLAKLKQQ